MQLFLKILSGMTNSVDSDHTTPLGLHCLHMSVIQTLWCLKFKDIYRRLYMQTSAHFDQNVYLQKFTLSPLNVCYGPFYL